MHLHPLHSVCRTGKISWYRTIDWKKNKVHVAPKHMFTQQVYLKQSLHIRPCTRCWRYTDLNLAFLELMCQQLKRLSHNTGWADQHCQTALLWVHPFLQCFWECRGRERPARNILREELLGQHKKICRAAPVPPPPLPSRTTRFNWREQISVTPEKHWDPSISNSPGCYCSPGQHCRAG